MSAFRSVVLPKECQILAERGLLVLSAAAHALGFGRRRGAFAEPHLVATSGAISRQDKWPLPRRRPKTGNGIARTKILTLNSTRDNFRYSIFLMIVVITMINYIDRGAISYAAESITREYGLDRVAWGTVLGYFGYGYMFGALLGGTFADVWGPKRVWLVAGFAGRSLKGQRHSPATSGSPCSAVQRLLALRSYAFYLGSQKDRRIRR